MRLSSAISLSFFVPAALVACKAKPAPTTTSAEVPTASATASATAVYRARPVTDGHAIEVRLDYVGSKRGGTWPIPAAYRGHCGSVTSVPNQSLDVVDATRVNGAVVWLDDIHEGEAAPTADVTQDEKGCVFLPHVMVAPVGAHLILTNSDPANHAIRLDFDGTPPLDGTTKLLAPDGHLPLDVKTEWAGRVARVTCPIHLWMNAYVFFFDHPYFALTKTGVARLEHVPPGTYHLDVWHEALDTKFDDELHASNPTSTRIEVTVGNADVVHAFTLGDDGAITPTAAPR